MRLSAEERSIVNQKNTYMRERRPNIYTAFEELNFHWDTRQVTKVMFLWQQGIALPDMARYLRRKQIEVAILVMDLAEQGKLLNRPGGIYGTIGRMEAAE